MNKEKEEKLREAENNLKKMQRKIGPFTEKEEKSAPSTRGDWVSGSSSKLKTKE